jgi:hypothetical protein
MKDEIRARRRCTSCRRWYVPAASAVDHQKTCGAEECQRQRRNQRARRRRMQRVVQARTDERVRQARHREKERRTRNRIAVSRACLSPQVSQIERVVLEKWDKKWGELARASRAGLRREIRVALGRASENVGQESAVT